ncbi:MAG: exosortase system-associated protein, TIGR04073 family [Nitrosomonas sp.]|nr:MAG: exosortase system-associated protein, TIGR04073 family [Nitrosomonas sp.]
MKFILQSTLIVFMSLLFLSPVMADEETAENSHFNRSGMKLFSGLANIATGWIELPKNVMLVGQQPHTPASGVAAIGLGVMQGTWYTINRMGAGVLDWVTFLLPTRASVDPVYVWDDFSRESKFMGY